MRKLVVSEYVTLDGVMEDPGGAEKSKHGGWSFQYWSPEAAKYKFDELFESDALLLGKTTYEGFAKAWPSMKDAEGFADRMNSIPKYVVSTTLKQLTWNNSHKVQGDIPKEIYKLKQQSGKNILLAGSAQLAQMLTQHNLVDEYRLMVHPIVVGGGKRVFKDGSEIKKLNLIDSKQFAKGIVVLHYTPAGDSKSIKES